MQVQNMKQKSVGIHDFTMNPRADVPRSSFGVRQGLKTAFSASYLVPIYCEEVLPGDTFNIACDVVARTAIPIVPILDNWHMEFFAFYTPNRILWTNWQKFMGEQANPGDSIAYTVPQTTTAVGGWAVGSLGDYFGLPTAGQVGGAATVSHNVLPLRAYNLIWNQWFRDENLQNSKNTSFGDGPDAVGNYVLETRGKRGDYFTTALPWTQKGTAVTLPLGTTANVWPSASIDLGTTQPSGLATMRWRKIAAPGTVIPGGRAIMSGASGAAPQSTDYATAAGGLVGAADTIYPSNLIADLSTATAATINQLRQSFQIQKLLERDARGGTRYVEVIQAHFGVRPPDYRLDRPEYIGGGKIPILVNAIPQTSATGLTGGTTPAGNLAATGYANGRVGFTYNATEHGYIIMLANVRADLTYQQGLRKHWSRSTRYDFYFPVFAMLGEQAILNKEIYVKGDANDNNVFGYIPRWDEYRHFPAQITGIFRSTAAGTLDYWHTSQRFASLPTLDATFIQDQTRTVIERNFAAGATTQGQQFLCDFMFTGRVARPLPMYSVPGMIDHF